MGKWEMVRLGDYIEQVRGVSYKPEDAAETPDAVHFPILRAHNIQDDGLNTANLIYVAKKKIKQNQHIKKGDIVVCASSGSKDLVGKAAQAKKDMNASFGAFCKVVRSRGMIEPIYLNHYFSSPFYRKRISELSAGANINNLRNEHIDDLQIPLPPLPVQQQIADVLDRASALIEKRKAQIEKLDLLVKSQFIEMFGDPVTNPKGWENAFLGDQGTFKNGMNFCSSDDGYRILCLGVGDFKDLRVIDKVDTLSSINLNAKPSKGYLLSDGDIVFVRSNGNRELIGRSVLIDTGGKDVTFSGFCIRFRKTSGKLNSIFLNAVLHSPSFKSRLLSNGRGANIQNLNQQMLSSQVIILPPMSRQDDFADFARREEGQKFMLQQSLIMMELNYKSLMQKCFRGEIF